MAIIAGKNVSFSVLIALSLLLSGCGLSRSASDGTVAMTRSLFYAQVKNLHLDIRAREALNSNADGVALSTVVRIYQLKERRTFDNADYPLVFASDSPVIKEDVLSKKDIRLTPGGAVSINMPLEEKTQYVAIAAMFLTPDQQKNTWRVVLSRDELDPDVPRLIEAEDNRLTLKPLEDG